MNESVDNIAVMVYVVESESSSLAVFEPLLRWLIATDVGVPCLFWYVAEVLRSVDHDASVFVRDAIHNAVACLGEGGGELPGVGVAHQVQVDELLADCSLANELLFVLWQWDAREVNLQELLVALAIGWCVQHAIMYWQLLFLRQHLLLIRSQSAFYFLNVLACGKLLWNNTTAEEHVAYSFVVVNVFPFY